MGIKCYLDLDGCIVDFVGGLHKALGVEYSPDKYPYESGKYDMFEDLCARTGNKTNLDLLYKTCHTAEFWANLEWDSMGKQIINTIGEVFPDWHDRVCICTSPMANPDAWKGKVQWLNTYLPWVKHIAIMTAPKHLLAKPGAILVDDKDSNVTEFRENGGAAWLCPQPWNSARGKFGTNYLPELKNFLECQKNKDIFLNNPLKLFGDIFGC
jgi:5'(3')-deoxyribonucleotidase